MKNSDILIGIKPQVEGSSVSQAKGQIQKALNETFTAYSTLNKKAIADAKASFSMLDGKKVAKVEIETELVLDETKMQFKEVQRLSDTTANKMAQAFAKAAKSQGAAAVAVKQQINEIAAQVDVLNAKKLSFGDGMVNQQTIMLDEEMAKLGKTTDQLNTKLNKVKTPATLKAELSEVNQKLSFTNRLTGETKKRFGKIDLGVFGKIGPINKLNTALGSMRIPPMLQKSGLFDKINPDFVELTKKSKEATKALNGAGGPVKALGAKFVALGATIQSAMGVFIAITAAIAALSAAIGQITSRTKAIQQLKLTLEGVGVAMEQQNAVVGRAKAIALGYGVSLTKVENAFRRLAPAVLEAGGTLNDADVAIQSIAARTTMLGLNSEQAGRYMEAFAQVIGKGKLQSEELNQQFSEMDGALRGQIANYVAATYGLTDLDDALKRGQITAAIFLEAFEAINQHIRSKFLKDINGTVQAIDNLGKQGGMTLNQLNAKMQAMTSIGLEKLGETFGGLGRELAKMYAIFVSAFTAMTTEMEGLQALLGLLGNFLGGVLKVTLVAIVGIIYAVAKAIDVVVYSIMAISKWISDNIPLMKELGKIFSGAFELMGIGADKVADSMGTLGDETTGVDAQIKTLDQEIASVNYSMEQMAAAGLKGSDAYKLLQDRLEKLSTKKAKKELDQLKNSLDATIEGLETDLKEAQVELEGIEERKKKEEELQDLMLEGIERKTDAKIAAHEKEKARIEEEMSMQNEKTKEVIEGIQEEIEAKKKSSDDLKRSIKEEGDAAKAQSDKAKAVVKEAADAEKSRLKTIKENVERRYEAEKRELDLLKESIEDRYSSEMSRLEAVKTSVESNYDEESKRIDELAAKTEGKYDAQVDGIEKAISASKALAEADAAILEGQKSSVQSRYESIIAGIESAKTKATAAHETEKAQIEAKSRATDAHYDKVIASIDRQEQKAKANFDKEMSRLDRQAAKIDSNLDKQLAGLDRLAAKSQAASDARVSALEAATPAEAALARLETEKLQARAQNAELTAEERLEAQAALERQQRSLEIKKEEAAEATRQQQIEAERAKAEEAAKVRQMAIDEERNRLEEARQAAEEKAARRRNRADKARAQSQERLAAALEASAEAQEARIAALEQRQSQADADRESAIDDLDSKAEAAAADAKKREDELNSAKEAAEKERDEALDKLADKEESLAEDKEKTLEKISAAEEEAAEKKATALEEVEQKESDMAKAKKQSISEIDAAMKVAANNEKVAIDSINDKRRQGDESRKNRIRDIDNDQRGFADAQKERISDIEDKQKSANDAFKAEIKEIENAVESLKTKQEEVTQEVDDSRKSEDQLRILVNSTTTALGRQNSAVQDVTSSFLDQEKVVNRIQSALKEIKSERAALESSLSSSPLDERASGGPVSAGTTYKVNEQGREGFLSASGVLSEIKTPALGKWTAPESGTVINAKQWKKIKASQAASWQEAGINSGLSISGTAGVSNASSAGSNGMSGMIRAIQGAMNSGDTFNQSVTVQSVNPTQTANNMMVEMTRLRRRRLG